MVDISLAQKAVQFLQEKGYAPTCQSYPMGHEVCMEQIHDIFKWLTRALT